VPGGPVSFPGQHLDARLDAASGCSVAVGSAHTRVDALGGCLRGVCSAGEAQPHPAAWLVAANPV